MYLKHYFKLCNMCILLLLVMMGGGGGGDEERRRKRAAAKSRAGIDVSGSKVENHVPSVGIDVSGAADADMGVSGTGNNHGPSGQNPTSPIAIIPAEAPFPLPVLDLESPIELGTMTSHEREKSNADSLAGVFNT